MGDFTQYMLDCTFFFESNPLVTLIKEIYDADLWAIGIDAANALFPNLVFDFDYIGYYYDSAYCAVDKLWFEHVSELLDGIGHVIIETNEPLTPYLLTDISKYICEHNNTAYLWDAELQKTIRIAFSNFEVVDK